MLYQENKSKTTWPDFWFEVDDFESDWEANENPLKSEGSLRFQSGTQKGRSDSNGKSVGSKGSGQNESPTNGNKVEVDIFK